MMNRALLTSFAALSLAACASAAQQTVQEAQPSVKRIAFTYDDGPMADGPLFTGEERTAMLIEALEKGGVEQAVFFMATKNLDREDAAPRIRAYAAAGHIIANHSNGHEWAHKMTAEDYLADIDLAEEKLKPFENRRPWFRFPYLDEGRGDIEKRDALRAGLAERGLMSGYVTIDTYDWHMVNLARQAIADGQCVNAQKAGEIYVDMFVDAAEYFHEIAVATLGRAPAQNILLHENDFAALFADDLAAGLRAAGWEIITADEAFADPIASQLPTTMDATDRVVALARDVGMTFEEMGVNAAANEKLINARFAEAGVFEPCDRSAVK